MLPPKFFGEHKNVHVIAKYPSIKSFVLWSDSCVPQNWNSIMCFALKKFLEQHEAIDSISQK